MDVTHLALYSQLQQMFHYRHTVAWYSQIPHSAWTGFEDKVHNVENQEMRSIMYRPYVAILFCRKKNRSISLQTNADKYSQEETLSGVPLRRTRSVCTLYSQCTSTRILTLVLPTALKTWQETGSVKKEWSAVVTNTLSLAPSSRIPPFAHLTSQQNWTDVKSAVKSTERSVFFVFQWGIQAWNIMNVFTLSVSQVKFLDQH